jgi:hypothetical protein
METVDVFLFRMGVNKPGDIKVELILIRKDVTVSVNVQFVLGVSYELIEVKDIWSFMY